MPSLSLLLTAFLTDSRIQPADYYGELPASNTVDQLSTTIHSLTALDFSQTFFFIDSDTGYKEYDRAIEDFTLRRFPQGEFSNHRLDEFQQWHSAIGQLQSDWTLLASNHDHPFIGSSEDWRNFLDLMDSSELDIAQISHWTESLGWRSLRWDQSMAEGLEMGFYATEMIGTILVRTSFLRSLFAQDFTNGTKFVRPDNPFGPSISFDRSFIVLPRTEFFRHLDGYGHVGLTANFSSYLRPEVSLSPNGSVQRTEWIRVSNEREEGDLLSMGPAYGQGTKGEKWTLPELQNLAYLATRYRLRFRVLFKLLQALSDKRMALKTISARFSDKTIWKAALAPIILPFSNFICRKGKNHD